MFGRVFRSYDNFDLIRRFLLLSMCENKTFSLKAEQVFTLHYTYILHILYCNNVYKMFYRYSNNVSHLWGREFLPQSLNRLFMIFL